MIAVENLGILPLQDRFRRIVGLFELLYETALGDVQAPVPKSRVAKKVEEDTKPFLQIFAQQRKGQRGVLIVHSEVQRGAEKIEPLFQGRSVHLCRSSLHEACLEELCQTGLFTGIVEAPVGNDGCDFYQRQGVVLLKVSPQTVGEGCFKGQRVWRGERQRGEPEIFWAGLSPQGHDSGQQDDNQQKSCFLHPLLPFTYRLPGCRRQR